MDRPHYQKPTLFLFILLSITAPQLPAQLYVWVDENGVKHISTHPETCIDKENATVNINCPPVLSSNSQADHLKVITDRPQISERTLPNQRSVKGQEIEKLEKQAFVLSEKIYSTNREIAYKNVILARTGSDIAISATISILNQQKQDLIDQRSKIKRKISFLKKQR